MLTYTSEYQLEEVRWSQEGNLIVIGRGDTLTQPIAFRSHSWSPVPYQVFVFSFPQFGEKPLGGTSLAYGPQPLRPIEVGHQSSRVCIRGINSLGWFDLVENTLHDRFDFDQGWIVAVSTDCSRILRQSSRLVNSSMIELTEWFLDGVSEDARKVLAKRKLLISPTQESLFFYGPDNQSIYRQRFDQDMIQRMRIVPKPSNQTESIPEFYAFTESQFEGERGTISANWKSSDGTLLILKQKRISLVSLGAVVQSVRLTGIGDPRVISCVSVHPSNRFLVLCRSNSNTVEVYDLHSQTIIRQFNWQRGPIRSVDCSPDGTMIAAIAGTNKIIVWDVDF